MKGKVKFYNISKRFGFIEAEDGKEYFVHESGLNEGVRVREEDQVTFDTEEGERGPKAVNVSLDDGNTESGPAEETSEEASEEEATEDAE